MITFPNNTKDIIDDIRDAIGRNVHLQYVAFTEECPTCELDPINNTSVDSFCLTCSGLYWIPVYSGMDIRAHISWKPFDTLGWVTGGQLFNGDCAIQIEYTELTKQLTEPKTVIFVDGKEMYIEDRYFRGVPDINRILLDLKERGRENE